LTILGLALMANFQNSAERSFTREEDLIPIDFPVFYLGGKVALQRGAIPLYYPPTDRSRGYTLLYENAPEATPWAQLGRANGFPEILRFTNPPFTALLMAPLAMLPWQWAYLLWQFIIVILTAAALFLTLKLLPSKLKLETFTLIFAALCFFHPFTSNLTFGQVNVSILFLWTLGVYLLKQGRPMASGLCLALGTALKVSPVAAVPLLALRRQWRWLAGYLAGIIAASAVSIWRLGWQTNLTWLTVIYPDISSGVGNNYNRSFAGVVDSLVGPRYFATFADSTQWAVPPGLGLFEKICSLAIGLGFLFWCWRNRKGAKGLIDQLILLPLITLLAAPFSWQGHFLLAVLPLAYLWARAQETTSGELLALYLSTLILGTELPMYVAAYSPWANPYFIIVANALWPLAICALIWVGMRMSIRSQVVEPQLGAAI
jgi:hypothetical protein